MPLSALNRSANVQVVGTALLVFATSAWLVYRGRHTAYVWVTDRLFGGPTSAASRVAQAGFLYLVAFMFAPWLLLFLSLVLPLAPLAMAGVVLTLLAPVYIAVGLFFRRFRAEYPMPWYIAGYALSVAGPLVAWAGPTWHFVTLAVTIALYAVSARIFRRSGWLYPVAGLTAVLFWQALGRFDLTTAYKPLPMLGLAAVYLLAGVILHHRRLPISPISGVINRYALPFFLGAYVVGALALALVVFQGKAIIVVGYLLGAAFYAASAAIFRQSLFAYPTAASLAVAYVAAMTMTSLGSNAYGPALLPGIAAFLVAAEVLRRRLDGSAPLVSDLQHSGLIHLRAWSMPFYIAVYLGTIAAPILAGTDATAAALTWWGIAAVYAVSVFLFRAPFWLYPTLIAGLAGYVAGGRILWPSSTTAFIAATLVVPTWLLIWVAYGIGRVRQQTTEQAVAAAAAVYRLYPGRSRCHAIGGYSLRLHHAGGQPASAGDDDGRGRPDRDRSRCEPPFVAPRVPGWGLDQPGLRL
ncbi:MAG: hypothetical protein U0822_03285 [Anaerolineae bacterium]